MEKISADKRNEYAQEMYSYAKKGLTQEEITRLMAEHHGISVSTVDNIIREYGIHPAPHIYLNTRRMISNEDRKLMKKWEEQEKKKHGKNGYIRIDLSSYWR